VHRLAHSVLQYIRQTGLLRAGERVGIAVSGGADSVALLRIALEIREELGIVLSLAHFNHKIRGAESDHDEQFVRQLAAQHALSFHSASGDAKTHAKSNKLSLETSARRLRYEFFKRLLSSDDVSRIATAHTLDDQAETVLLKLVRGAGTRGLAGIYPRVSVQHSAINTQQSAIVRPLLATRRLEVEAYLQEIKQNWREDASNRDLQHTRNRIRHDVLPRLEEALNPRVRETLAEAAEIARAEEEFWSERVNRILGESWRKEEQGGRLRLDLIRGAPVAVQRRTVRAAGEALGLNLEFCHVEEIIALAKEGARAALPHDWTAVLHKNEIRFGPVKKPPTDYSYVVAIPGRVKVREAGVVIDAVVVSEGEHAAALEGLLRPDAAQKSLLIRNWRAGDRFWPSHAKQPKKIKELLQDLHITGEEKKNWPVIATGDEVVWVKGLGVRWDFQAKNGTGILIREKPLGISKASGGQV
jgi:tRNA(Ile)-lysidine synthase